MPKKTIRANFDRLEKDVKPGDVITHVSANGVYMELEREVPFDVRVGDVVEYIEDWEMKNTEKRKFARIKEIVDDVPGGRHVVEDGGYLSRPRITKVYREVEEA